MGKISCIRCQSEGEKLDEIPFQTELGQKIYNQICKVCFKGWIKYSINILNEYRLDLYNAEHAKRYDSFMEEYFFGNRV